MLSALDSRSRRTAAALPLLVRQQTSPHAKADIDSQSTGWPITHGFCNAEHICHCEKIFHLCGGESKRLHQRCVHAITKASVWSANDYFYEWGWR